MNNAVHTEDGMRRLQMEDQTAVPGDGFRYGFELWKRNETSSFHFSGALRTGRSWFRYRYPESEEEVVRSETGHRSHARDCRSPKLIWNHDSIDRPADLICDSV